jgi:excisionase family DNA binding protein
VEEESYTVQEAARILRTTERTVRRRLERGDLEGTRSTRLPASVLPALLRAFLRAR